MRFTASQPPRMPPYSRSASLAYSEQLGAKRQLTPSSGETVCRYNQMAPSNGQPTMRATAPGGLSITLVASSCSRPRAIRLAGPAPSRAGGPTCDGNAHGRGAVADRIGRGEITVFPCLLALLEQALDLRSRKSAFLAAGEPFFGIHLHEAQEVAGGVHLQREFPAYAAVGFLVQLPRDAGDFREGKRRIDVVFQRRNDRRRRLRAGPVFVAHLDAADGTVKAVEPRARSVDSLVGPVERLPVVSAEEREAQDLAREHGYEVVHQQHVSQRLRHFLLVHAEIAVVQPVTRECPSTMGAGALRQLILVVREHEILPTRVYVDGLPQVFRRHRRTFDVPARPAAPPGRLPARLVLRGRFPQHEVLRCFLVWRNL